MRVSWQIFPGCRFFRQLRKRGLHLGRVTSGPNSQPVSLTQKALSDPEQCQNCIKRSATESRKRVEGLFGILRFITCQVQCCYFTENTASLSSRYILLLNAMLASAFFDWRQSLSSDSCLQSGLAIKRVATFFWST